MDDANSSLTFEVIGDCVQIYVIYETGSRRSYRGRMRTYGAFVTQGMEHIVRLRIGLLATPDEVYPLG